MISAITEYGQLMASEAPQPSKMIVILLSAAIFIAVSAVTAVVTYRLKMKKFREKDECICDDVKEQENDF